MRKHPVVWILGMIAPIALFYQAVSNEKAARGVGQAPGPAVAAPAESSVEQSVERGRYLVHHVAMCVQCHSPRTPSGELIERKWLRGARIPVQAPYADQPWAFYAPQLAGLPGYSTEDLIVLLRTGRRRDGTWPRSPMPRFQMNQSDAAAVAAYLAGIRP